MGTTRWLPWMAVGWLGLVPLAAPAQPDVGMLLDQAIAAHGGQKNLTTLKAGYLQSKGTAYLAGPVSLVNLTVYQLPDQLKQIQEIDQQGQKVRIVTGCQKDKVWMTVNGQKRPVDKKILTEIQEALHLLQVNRLVALKEKPFRLASAGETQVNQRPADGLRVSREGYRDVLLFFDRATHRLVMLAHQVPDLVTGKEVLEQRLYSEYRSVNGIQEPKKVIIWRNGQKFLEGEATEAQILEQVDQKIFDNPS